MPTGRPDHDDPAEALHARLADAEEMLRAIRQGEIDALVVEGAGGNQVFTLQSADEPYRNLVEQMQEGAVVLTRLGDIVYANTRFAALVGEPLQAVVGGPFARFLDPTDRGEFDAMWEAGRGRSRTSLIGPGAVPFEVSASLATMSTGNGGRLNLIVTDLRELLDATSRRDRAERDNRSKDDFLAMLAHELRNPLGAIGMAVRVLEATHATGERATNAHEVIARQVGHITHLIDDLLDIERVVSGKMRLSRQPLDLAEAVRGTVAAFAGDPRLNRQIEVSIEPAWVDGDPVRIDQVLTNLVTNAVKYTPQGGLIRVTLCADGGDVILTVTDSGYGISASLLPRIFDMYVQADQTISQARGGLGIGLALVRRLVELHGGTVTASSDGEGQGSRFVVRLRQAAWAGATPTSGAALERRAQRRRVLLIEDSAEAREALQLMLELAGHEVYSAADGMHGLELLQVARPDVGIIDVSPPATDGYQFAKRIRETPYGRSMLLLALSSREAPDDPNRALEHGFDHHLVRPVDPNHLAQLLGRGIAQG